MYSQDTDCTDYVRSSRLKRLSKRWLIIKPIYDAGYNLIPIDNKSKKPVIFDVIPYRTERLQQTEVDNWLSGHFTKKDGTPEFFKTEDIDNINFALLMGDKPYSDAPALVAVDADDEEAFDYVSKNLPTTPIRQITKRGGHFIYRKPTSENGGEV